jgi:hypothetical protein
LTPAAIAAAMAILLAPALWNGFPLLFYDTGAFIDQALTGKFMPERSVFYAWFMKPLAPQWSLWPLVVVQAAMTAWVLWILVRVVAPRLGPAWFLAIVLATAIGTGLPWYVGQVLPDFLSPLLILAIYLLGFKNQALRPVERVFLFLVAVLAITAHASHIGLAVGLAAIVAGAQLLKLRSDAVRPNVLLPALAVAASLATLVASNYVRTGEAFLSRSGPAFVFGRLVQDGIAQRLLDDTCPQSGYKLCAYKANLTRSADDWLWKWETPFWKLGGFEGLAAESTRMILDSIKRYPLLHLQNAARATAEQFVTFRTGDGLHYHEHPTDWLMRTLLPGQYAAYKAAWQQQSEDLSFDPLNLLHVPVGILSLLAGLVCCWWACRRSCPADPCVLPVFLLLALLGNAFICGALSNPHDRYQSRVLWTLSFCLLVLAADRRQTVKTD